MDRRLRELGLLSATLGAAILRDTKLFGPIHEYGRRLAAVDIARFDRGALDDLSLVVDRVDGFFQKYRSTPDGGFYIEPQQITGSDDDLRRLVALIAELEPLEDSVITTLSLPKPAGLSTGAQTPTPREHRPSLGPDQGSASVHPLIKKRKLPNLPTPLNARRGDAAAIAKPRVFVVHGHDLGVRDAVARLLAGLGLDPVVLSEQPNKGRTIIEKFEDYSDVVFAVVVLSPDDLGGAIGHEQRPRARQNVILELGFFIGQLGRDRVAALRVGDLEEPADVRGIAYIPYDVPGAWRMKLGQELRAAGIEVDLNDIR